MWWVRTARSSLRSAFTCTFHCEVQTKSFTHSIACSVNLQLYTRVALCGIQWVDSTVAVVISSDPHLVSQLESNISPAEGNVLSVPQVHLTAEIKDQSLDIKEMYELANIIIQSSTKSTTQQQESAMETSHLSGAQQGDGGDGGPGLFMGHQSVLHQPVHTVGLYHTTLIDIILLWCTGSCGESVTGHL